jgi:hypothetical protein
MIAGHVDISRGKGNWGSMAVLPTLWLERKRESKRLTGFRALGSHIAARLEILPNSPIA